MIQLSTRNLVPHPFSKTEIHSKPFKAILRGGQLLIDDNFKNILIHVSNNWSDHIMKQKDAVQKNKKYNTSSTLDEKGGELFWGKSLSFANNFFWMRNSAYCKAVWKYILLWTCHLFPNLINVLNMIFNATKLFPGARGRPRRQTYLKMYDEEQ